MITHGRRYLVRGFAQRRPRRRDVSDRHRRDCGDGQAVHAVRRRDLSAFAKINNERDQAWRSDRSQIGHAVFNKPIARRCRPLRLSMVSLSAEG